MVKGDGKKNQGRQAAAKSGGKRVVQKRFLQKKKTSREGFEGDLEKGKGTVKGKVKTFKGKKDVGGEGRIWLRGRQ